MKTLYIEANMGAAGDMLTAALLEVLDDRASFVEKLNALGIPGVEYKLEESVKCGITGSHMTVLVKGEEEESHDLHECHHHEDGHECCHHHEHDHEHECCHHHDHEHDHECSHHHEHEHEHGHHHEHHHSHNTLSSIKAVINALPVSDRVKEDAYGVYALIAEAESHAHGRPVEEVHFHEVGAMDAVADVVAVCALMEEIDAGKVIVSPINTGNGHCHTAHGILPVPAPATAYILQGVPNYDGGVRGELCTPTGAALLKHFATSFGPRPVMTISKTGYGMGKKDFERANCVRAMLGETEGTKTDEVIELQANIDDMCGEDLSYAAEKVLEAGALDVWMESIQMKKGRPGTKFCVLVAEDKETDVVKAIFSNTTTIGIRRSVKERYVLSRESYAKETDMGCVNFKRSFGYGVDRAKPEFEDVRRIAEEKNLSIREVREKI